MIKVFPTIQETDYPKIVSWIIQQFGEKNNFFLTGGLGAGKTTFSRNFAQILKVRQIVSSPSFTIMNQYDFPEGKIYHLDLYRLNTEEEAFEIGLEEILEEPQVKIIEWADKFPAFMKNGYQIDFQLNNDFTRKITILKK